MRTLNRGLFFIAFVSVLAGCNKEGAPSSAKNDEPADRQTPATAAASDQATAPASDPSIAAAPDPVPPFDPSGAALCDEDKLRATINGMADAMSSYFKQVTPVVQSKESCAVVTKKLKTLEPHANRFVEAITASMSSMQALSTSCQEQAKEMGEAMTTRMQKEFPDAENIDVQMRILVERCKQHPGFEQAASKGLKMMRRKQ